MKSLKKKILNHPDKYLLELEKYLPMPSAVAIVFLMATLMVVTFPPGAKRRRVASKELIFPNSSPEVRMLSVGLKISLAACIYQIAFPEEESPFIRLWISHIQSLTRQIMLMDIQILMPKEFEFVFVIAKRFAKLGLVHYLVKAVVDIGSYLCSYPPMQESSEILPGFEQTLLDINFATAAFAILAHFLPLIRENIPASVEIIESKNNLNSQFCLDVELKSFFSDFENFITISRNCDLILGNIKTLIRSRKVKYYLNQELESKKTNFLQLRDQSIHAIFTLLGQLKPQAKGAPPMTLSIQNNQIVEKDWRLTHAQWKKWVIDNEIKKPSCFHGGMTAFSKSFDALQNKQKYFQEKNSFLGRCPSK